MSLIENREFKILSDLDSYDGVVTMAYSQDVCVVCGDRASGRHYGAISCEGCKGFFKRSIRKQLGYTCRGTKTCEVTKHHRNRCQYCRLQKCLQMGMHSDSVQHERKPIKEQSLVKSELQSEEDESCGEDISTLDVLHMLFKEEKPTMIFSDIDPLPKDSFKFLLKAPGPYLPQPPLNTQYVCEASSRLLFSSVHWARKLPAFKALDEQTEIAVIRSAWAELFAIGLVQYDNVIGLRHAIQGGSGSRLQSLLEFSVQLQALLRAIVAADLDPMGFAILRCLTLFSPDRGARFALSQAFADLQVAVIEKYNYENTERLLLLLPQLRALNGGSMEDLFFNGFLGGVGVDGVIPFILSMEDDEPGD